MCGVVDLDLACQTADPGSLPRIDDSVPSWVRVNSRILYALSINRGIDKSIIKTTLASNLHDVHLSLLEKEQYCTLLSIEPGGLAGLPKNPF